jgi:hypothetical protein
MSSRAILIASLIATSLVAACGAATGPSPSPAGTPASTPTPTTTSSGTPAPTEAVDPTVVLDVANGWDLVATLTDDTGRLVSAASGHGDATMTVRWFDAQVVNVDPSTIELTWVGLPQDEEITITLSEVGGKVVIDVNQAAPPLYSDAEGLDRVLVLTFSSPVDAGDVSVKFAGAPA